MLPSYYNPTVITRIYFLWRRLHALHECRKVGFVWSSLDEWLIDTGYCLDRYTLGD